MSIIVIIITTTIIITIIMVIIIIILFVTIIIISHMFWIAFDQNMEAYLLPQDTSWTVIHWSNQIITYHLYLSIIVVH